MSRCSNLAQIRQLDIDGHLWRVEPNGHARAGARARTCAAIVAVGAALWVGTEGCPHMRIGRCTLSEQHGEQALHRNVPDPRFSPDLSRTGTLPELQQPHHSSELPDQQTQV